MNTANSISILTTYEIQKEWVQVSEPEKHPVLGKAVAQLREYFAGERREFDLPLRPSGTVFQMVFELTITFSDQLLSDSVTQEVWKELQRIPYGEVISYSDLARRINRPNAYRYVPRRHTLCNQTNTQ